MTATMLHAAPRAAQVCRAADASVLRAILEPDVTLALWQRDPLPDIVVGDRFENLEFEAPVLQTGGVLNERLRLTNDLANRAIAVDIAALAVCYAAIIGCDRVAVRLERVTGKGCWRFHADYVTVRLLSTYIGQGTQWLPPGRPDADDLRQMASGDVGLFKGRLLAGEDAAVHRSPPIEAGDEQRLLLAIDPPADVLHRARERYEARAGTGRTSAHRLGPVG